VFNADHLGKTKSVGRLVTFAALGGVLVAGLVLPAVGSVGVAVKTAATKFDAMSTKALGQVPQRSEILDSEGHRIAYIYDVNEPYFYGPNKIQTVSYGAGIDRQPVSYDQISPNVRNAVIAIEDSRYWLHGAIDFRGTLRAIVNDLQHQPVQGGSTIAQQYVKNVLILTAKDPLEAENATSETLSRKIHELRLAIAIEHQMSKQDILAGYLNDAYFGYPIVGVETAAETFFGTSADKLTVDQGATLAGMVEDPARYNPTTNPGQALQRRNTVIARMAQLRMISGATAKADENKPLGLHTTHAQNGCTSSTASKNNEGFFCDYVVQSILRDSQLGKTPEQRAQLLATGGLKIYTTLNRTDQRAANNAVNYVLPPHGSDNPGKLADAEALIQPGTGRIRGIAEDRPYGSGHGHTTIDYAATTPYDGGSIGVQTGSSSKLFTLVTALEQGIPFGFSMKAPNSADDTGYYNCNGQSAGSFKVVNASAGDAGEQTLYTGTTFSVNTFYAALEQKVGLCNVVKTAAKLGMTWGNGTSLFHWDHPYGKHGNAIQPADDTPSFTLGSVTVAPISMAAAYATMAARGKYCTPIALESITTDTGKKLPVPSAHCHQAVPTGVADAVNYILQGVITQAGATADNRGINRPAAAKTGTAGSATTAPPSAAFAGYTPTLTGYVWVGGPTKTRYMSGYPYGCYRDNLAGYECAGSMFGDNAPGATWQMTFLHAALGRALSFVAPDPDGPLFAKGTGQSPPKTKTPPKHGGGGGHCPPRTPICPLPPPTPTNGPTPTR
jgi:membrane peptidoglycan carboxypeptidase